MATENKEPGIAKTAPMYASYRVFTGFLDWLDSMPAIPEQLDRSLAGGRYSGSLWSHLMSGLQFLDLAQGAVPKPELEELVKAKGDQRKVLIEATLRRAYGDEFISRLPRMTPQIFDKHLDDLGSSPATRNKAASFLTNALKDTDVEVPATIAKRARNRQTVTARRSGSRKASTTSPDQPNPSPASGPKLPGGTEEPSSVKMLTLRGDRRVSLVADFDVLSADPRDLDWLVEVVKKFDEKKREIDAETLNDSE